MEDIVKRAEDVVNSIHDPNLTVTQIRKILAAVNAISNKILAYQSESGVGKELETLPNHIADEIRYLEVRIAYQCRNGSVKNFVEKAKIRDMVKGIGNDYKKYDRFAKFIEAIVAFKSFKEAKSNVEQ